MTKNRTKIFRNDTHRVNAAALNKLPAIVKRWLPDGHMNAKYWVAKSPRGLVHHAAGLRVNLKDGRWRDYATGEAGADVISLAAFVGGSSNEDAAKNLARMLELR
jgi:hypothetical protein